MYRRLGVKTGAERRTPTGNPSPAPTHPHRTHDTTDQWRDRRLWLGRFFENFLPVRGSRPTSNCHRHAAFCNTSKLILRILRDHGSIMASQGAIRVIKMRFSWIHDIFKFEESARTRVASVVFPRTRGVLKNRFRSRTRVTTLTINYVLDARSRACIQRDVFRIHFWGAHQTDFEIYGSTVGVWNQIKSITSSQLNSIKSNQINQSTN